MRSKLGKEGCENTKGVRASEKSTDWVLSLEGMSWNGGRW